ncbi:MAG TPA: hypothetical protein EYH03_06115 [Chromatiales bacterium]|nr:hypothetical protein [Chromatiales bacterium]
MANQISNANIPTNSRLYDPPQKQTQERDDQEATVIARSASSLQASNALQDQVEVDATHRISRTGSPPAGTPIHDREEAMTLVSKLRDLMNSDPHAALAAHSTPGNETVSTLLSRPSVLEG